MVAELRARGATVHAPAIEQIDLTDEAAVAAYYAGVPVVWASIHLVGGFTMAPIAETRLADLDRMLSINTRTCFLACREAVIAMRRSSGGGDSSRDDVDRRRESRAGGFPVCSDRQGSALRQSG